MCDYPIGTTSSDPVKYTKKDSLLATKNIIQPLTVNMNIIVFLEV